MFALPIFPGSHPPSIVVAMNLTSVSGMAVSPSAARGGCSEGATCAAVGRKQACFVRRSFRRAPQTETGGTCSHSIQIIHKKKTSTFLWRLVFALPIFPGSHPPSIVGANELNFCVRNGNRWTLIAINTNYSSSLRMVTHTGFEPMLTA